MRCRHGKNWTSSDRITVIYTRKHKSEVKIIEKAMKKLTQAATVIVAALLFTGMVISVSAKQHTHCRECHKAFGNARVAGYTVSMEKGYPEVVSCPGHPRREK